MSWTTCRLGDALTLKRGYDLPARRRLPGEVPVVSSSGITGYHSRAKRSAPGVVTGRYGTLGNVYYMDSDYWPLNTALYVVDFKGTLPRFAAYFLKHVLRDLGGDKAAVPGVHRETLHHMQVSVPDARTQETVASILSAYDDLIENNRRRIQLLDEAARLLYREWFLHLRFPGHEQLTIVDGVPEGWECVKLFDIAHPTYGFAFKSKLFSGEQDGDSNGIPVARIRDIPSGASTTYTTEEASPDKLLRDGDYVVGMDGTFHQSFWTGGKAWINQRVVRISSGNDAVGDAFLRYACEQPICDLNLSIVGTTVAHLGAKHLQRIHIMLPPKSLLSRVSQILESTRWQIVTLAKQRIAATQARDLLLPRLMNGEISI